MARGTWSGEFTWSQSAEAEADAVLRKFGVERYKTGETNVGGMTAYFVSKLPDSLLDALEAYWGKPLVWSLRVDVEPEAN